MTIFLERRRGAADRGPAFGSIWYPRARASGDPILKLVPTQLEILRRHSSEGLRRAAEVLRARQARAHPERATPGALGLAVVELRSIALGEFPCGAPLPDGDTHAVVALPIEGRLSGTALLALEPHDALRWIRSAAPGEDPLAAFVEIGARVLAEWTTALARAFGVHACPGRAGLREDSVVGVALATHAPPCTALLCARLSLAQGDDDVGEGHSLPAFLYLMVESKLIAALLPALEAR